MVATSSTAAAAGTGQDWHVAVLISNEVMSAGLAAVLHSVGMVGAVHRCRDLADLAALQRRRPAQAVIVAARDAHWLAEVRKLSAPTGKIVVIVDMSAPVEAAALPPGADGFLSQQDLSADTLRETLRGAYRGVLPMPPELARALLGGACSAPPARPARTARLTVREMQTLSLLAQGLSNQQISGRLGISVHGAKRLVAAVMMKLDAPNRTAAVVNAINGGLLSAS